MMRWSQPCSAMTSRRLTRPARPSGRDTPNPRPNRPGRSPGGCGAGCRGRRGTCRRGLAGGASPRGLSRSQSDGPGDQDQTGVQFPFQRVSALSLLPPCRRGLFSPARKEISMSIETISLTLTVGTMTFDLSDPVSRLVAADALADAGRAVESRILRKTDQAVVVVPETGHVVRAEHDAPARKHKRIPRPGDGIQGNRRDERRKLGEIFRSKKWGGMFVVSESSALRYVSSDAIEDMDAWAEYPDGPGKYSRWVAVPVEETDKERKERETDETAKRSAEDEAAAKKKAIEATWSAVSAQHHIYSLPEGLIPASAWRVLSDERDAKFRSGNVRYIADLPDGGVVGHLSHRSYDDHQDHYYVPVSLVPVIEAAQAAIAVRRAREQETVEAYQADRAALVTEGCTEAAVRMAGCDEAAKTASTAYVESGDAATLDSYHEVLAAVARRITAERNAAY